MSGRYVFRFDVSPSLGTGHLQRCRVLARELMRRGGSVHVAQGGGPATGRDLWTGAEGWTVIESGLSPEDDGREVARLCRDFRAHAAVVDLYTADQAFQQTLSVSGARWLQFDAFGKQPLWADWVLNASPWATPGAYAPLVQRTETQLLLGPSFILLRPEFQSREARVATRDRVERILITLGGGDDRGSVVFCLEALRHLPSSVQRVVLLSSYNPRVKEIREWVNRHAAENVTVLIDEPHVALRMSEADLGITAGGTTAFETAAMGLPSLIIQLADNQAANAAAWERVGAAVDLGPRARLSPNGLSEAVMRLSEDGRLRAAMGRAGQSCVDGLGATRVAERLVEA